MLLGRDKFASGKLQCAAKQILFESESVIANVCLGVAVTGLYTLVGMGLLLVFM